MCPVGLRPVNVWTAVMRKAGDLHQHSYFENGSSLNSQSEEKQGLDRKSFVGLAHFSVVLVKVGVWLHKRVYRNSATLWS